MNDTLNTARTRITAVALALTMAMVPAAGLAAEDTTTQSTATTTTQGRGTNGATTKTRDVGTDDQTTTSTDAATGRGKGAGRKGRATDGTTKSNDEYVNGLVGLTDAERKELLELMNKRDALAEGEKLSDTDRARMSELKQKARFAKAQEAIDADTSLSDSQKTELKSKLDELANVESKIDDYLSDPTYKKLEEQRSQAEEALGTYLGHGGHHRMK